MTTTRGRRSSPLERYRAWKHANKTVGCVFARLIAGARDDARYGYRSELVEGSNPQQLASEIAQRVNAAVGEPDIKGLSLVFPDVRSVKLLVEVATALAKEPHWTVSRSVLKGKPFKEAVAFHISRALPFNNTSIPSEVLILGPFPRAFPRTRRSPVTALELYVGTPAPANDFMGKPTKKAHLALLEVFLPAEIFKRLAVETVAIRRESLGGVDDLRAKAKVTFSLPMKTATSLGCVP